MSFQLLGPLCTFMISYLRRKTRQIDVMSTKNHFALTSFFFKIKFVYLFCYDRCIFTRNQQRFVLMLWRNFLSFFFKFSWRTRVTTSKSTFSILLPGYSTALHHHPNEQQIKFCLNPKKLSSKITFFYQFSF